ncbi:MAG TPA: hypothetical protein ENJ19_00695 [Gammaproteobacteria bacterium]|nr:hypothetical protein [Gammaproteobacteria bacterium]
MAPTEQHRQAPRQTGRCGWGIVLTTAVFSGACLAVATGLPGALLPARPILIQTPSPAVRPAPAFSPGPAQAQVAVSQYLQGLSALEHGETGAAGRHFKTALEKQPTLAAAYVGLAKVALMGGDWRSAELNARHAIALLRQHRDAPVDTGRRPTLLSHAQSILSAALRPRP